MKKILLIFIGLFLGFISFSIEKSKIAEYDNLDFSKGKVIIYFDKDFNHIDDSESATFYRKVFHKNNDLYVIADFYAENDNPILIFKASNPENNDTKMGKEVHYDISGNLLSISELKNGNFNGERTTYKDGKLKSVANYSDNELISNTVTYKNGKKIVEYVIKNGVLNGDTTLYNIDGSKSSAIVYENERPVSVKVFNYKRQKTGIPEYDTILTTPKETLAYYDFSKNITSKNDVSTFFYRKILKKENDLYLVADYILDSDIILNLSKVRKPKDISGSSFEGYSITFNENGALQKKSFFNNGKLEGEEIEYNYFGIPQIINNYKNGNLINTIYLDAE